MEMTESNVYEAFGIEQKGEGAPEAETSAAANSEELVAEAETGAEETGAEQTPEERRQNAARRRQQEQKAAVDKAVQEALERERETSKADWENFFQEAKLKNTVTGEPITTKAEFDVWKKQFADAKRAQKMKAGTFTAEDLDEAIQQNPAVKAAQEIVEREKKTAEERQAEENRKQIAAEVAEISKIDPTIKSAEDFLTMPNAAQFYDLVQKGLSFKDAYYLVNRERVDAATVNEARSAAGRAARGKDHLSATGNARGAGAISVPAQDMAYFKLLNPQATPEQIQQYYNQYNKK